MRLRHILAHIFSTQISREPHTPHDSIQLFGVLAVLTALVPGSFLFLYLAVQPIPIYAKLVGFGWMIYAELLALGLVLHEHGNRRHAAHYFTGMGIAGCFLGAGFFLSAFSSIATGILLYKYTKQQK